MGFVYFSFKETLLRVFYTIFFRDEKGRGLAASLNPAIFLILSPTMYYFSHSVLSAI